MSETPDSRFLRRSLPLFLLGWMLLGSIRVHAGTPSPFDGLEAALRKGITQEREKLKTAGMLKEGREKESSLALLRQHLHDIRNHRAFWELWQRWGWNKPELEVLYVGSGAHLAPLVFLHGPNPLKRATYTFTEVNPYCAMRMEALLGTMVRAGLYQDLTVEAGPVPGSRFAERWAKERGPKVPTSGSAMEFTRWIMAASQEMAIPPSFVAKFHFRKGATRAEIRLFVKVPDTRPESTAYFNLSDLEAVDLAITHDWDYDPRGNLRVLLDFVESYWAGSRAKPLAVMMEDLRKYPSPVEMGLFNPVATSDSGYGHQEFLTWSDGTKAEEEDGATLYGGGVILEPDMAYLGSLSRGDRTALFDLTLFEGAALGRRNVDVVGGKRILAPALLDLGAGYASFDVRGEDLSARPDFLAHLARATCHLPASSPPLPESMRPLWCKLAARFEESLRDGEAIELGPIVEQAERDLKENPFVRGGQSRAKLQKFLKEKERMGVLLESQRRACSDAMKAMDEGREDLRKICPPGAPPNAAAPQNTSP